MAASLFVIDGHSDVSVSDGTVRDFFHGVQVVNGSHNTVSGIASIDNTNGNGIVLRNVTNSSLSHNTVLGSGRFGGISVFDGRRPEQLDDLPSARNVLANNVVERSDNGPNTAGISLENGPGHKVMNNRVSGSSGDGINLRADNPLPSGRVLAAVTGAMVVNNVVTGNGTNAANIAPPLAGISLRQNVNTGVGADNTRSSVTGSKTMLPGDLRRLPQQPHRQQPLAGQRRQRPLRHKPDSTVRQQHLAQQHLRHLQPGLRHELTAAASACCPSAGTSAEGRAGDLDACCCPSLRRVLKPATKRRLNDEPDVEGTSTSTAWPPAHWPSGAGEWPGQPASAHPTWPRRPSRRGWCRCRGAPRLPHEGSPSCRCGGPPPGAWR